MITLMMISFFWQLISAACIGFPDILPHKLAVLFQFESSCWMIGASVPVWNKLFHIILRHSTSLLWFAADATIYVSCEYWRSLVSRNFSIFDISSSQITRHSCSHLINAFRPSFVVQFPKSGSTTLSIFQSFSHHQR